MKEKRKWGEGEGEREEGIVGGREGEMEWRTVKDRDSEN